MPDGVRLALDVWRARTSRRTRRSPCLLPHAHWRAFDLVEAIRCAPLWVGPVARRCTATVVTPTRAVRALLFGQRVMEWSREERADLWHVIDWVIVQKWSDGRVMAHGYSYGGNTAFPAASTGHLALVAVAPQFADTTFTATTVSGGIANCGSTTTGRRR